MIGQSQEDAGWVAGGGLEVTPFHYVLWHWGKKNNLSVTSPKGVRSSTLKCIWLHPQGKVAHDVSSSCEEIKGVFQHQDSSLPLSFFFFFGDPHL